MTRKSTPKKVPCRQKASDLSEAKKLDKARGLLQGPSLAANAIDSLKMTEGLTETTALIEALYEQTNRVIDGDLNRAGSLLICQAQTLDALFNRELMTAMRQDGLPQWDAHMKAALRAQSQCRATLETLATIKNPPVLIAKQANIAHGPQQVNNGAPPAGDASRARGTENAQKRLLEADGERLDTLPASTTSGSDPEMAALGKGDRP